MTHIDWNHPDMKKIKPEKLELLKLAASELDNKSTDASLSYILALNSKLKNKIYLLLPKNLTYFSKHFQVIYQVS